ncbi:hypothetical protein [Burkholderia multivorans]|uniref:hypothetical protein n=1 Tax=Burkholderia multivorans TaxID=87883 RepID=UPI00201A0289|nr:hypothetical protein [Burkholderia multivorans]MCO1368622.1 hypothetical protein [Burkholderia multivorans]MCO1380513.1 hypothetical protein [Burkholderia multivorans]MDN8032423.1 hypothetical protein [Burkholderia multivorans]UQP22058.1 hypothetical protein L0Y98_18115 [Burkholderia multivorans]UQP91494.1 hypothetical protein L0Y91_29155 [Burkholderia multivorans]
MSITGGHVDAETGHSAVRMATGDEDPTWTPATASRLVEKMRRHHMSSTFNGTSIAHAPERYKHPDFYHVAEI